MNHKVAISFADGKTHFFPIKAGELLLDAALRNGINIPLDCREGVCGTCMGRCESGQYSLDYVDEEALSPSDLQQRKVLACQTRVRSDAAFYFDVDSTLCSASGTRAVQARVSEVELLSASTALLHLEAGGDSPLDFLPGQYARLQVPGTEAHRAYSFANRPNVQNRLLFLIRLLPGGVMSDYLRERCKAGDEIRLEAPLGAFYLRQVERPLVMVAGGTGLSAFLGMLDELAERGCDQPVQLYHGVRQPADLCELERLRLRRTYPGLHLHPGGQRRRAGLGRQARLRQRAPGPCTAARSPFDMYLCGPPPMIESMKTWLQENALDGNPLYLEKFTESGT